MSQIDKERFAVATQLLYKLGVGEAQTATHLLVGDVHQLHRLQYVVTEVAVKPLLNLAYLLFGLLGKGALEILAHHLTSVPYDVVYERVDEVAQYIEYPQRPYGYGLECEREQGKLKFFPHVFL